MTANKTRVRRKGQFHTVSDVTRYMYAGKAEITLVNSALSECFSYRVSAVKDSTTTFLVSVRDLNRWTYIGKLTWANGRPWFVLTHNSEFNGHAPQVANFNALLQCLDLQTSDDLIQSPACPIEVWHNGRCGKCNRPLGDEAATRTGFGGECRLLVGLPAISTE